MRPFAVAIGSPFAPIAWTFTSAPSFQRPAWIEAADSSATTVRVFPAAATYGTNGRFARSRIVSAASRGVPLAADAAAGADDCLAPADASAAISASVGALYWRRARMFLPFSLTVMRRMLPCHFVLVV